MDKAMATQLANIEKRTGKSLAELTDVIKASGLTKHGELRDLLKRDLAMGHGDANLIVHLALKSAGATADEQPLDAILDDIYSGAKADLRPIHDAVMKQIEKFGSFEIAPKKGYVSLRRKKQFAMVGPATKTAIEIGMNAKDLPSDARLTVVPPGGMCQYKVRLGSVGEVDQKLVAWLKAAYDGAAG
jgi:hypothetical protein